MNSVKGCSGTKFYVDVEGVEYEWDSKTITVWQIKNLINMPADHQIMEELPNGSQKVLTDSELITLKPFRQYGRATKYKRC
jgi:hypothetical protein